MTVHVAITLLVLLALLGASRAPEAASSGRQGWLFGSGLLLLLPLGFAPIVPISHYVFEATSDHMAWFAIVFSLLWSCTAWCWLRRAEARGVKLGVSALLATMAFWGALGVFVSHYEHGATPSVTDSPIYVAHWLSILIAAALLVQLIAGRRPRSGWRVATTVVLGGGYLLLYVWQLAWLIT